MPRDGSGVYTLPPGLTAVPNATIESADWNNFTADMQTDANAQRPIIAGGTGAGNVAGAQTNLQIVPSTGGTFTGNVAIEPASGNAQLFLNPPSGQNGFIWGQRGGTMRWRIIMPDSAAESGANVGSDFYIQRADDTGTALGVPLYIKRSTGNVGIGTTTPGALTGVAANIKSVLTIANGTERAALELQNGQADADNLCVGHVSFQALNSVAAAAAYQVASILGFTDGATAANRGGKLSFYTKLNGGGLAERLTIREGGNIGIGTASPNAKLEVNGGTAATVIRAATVSGTAAVSLQLAPAGAIKAEFSCQLSGNATYLDFMSYLYFRDTAASYATRGAFDSSGNFTLIGQGYKPGGGPWLDSSDARIKTVAGDYTLGLDAVLQLRPVLYSFKGNDTGEPPQNLPFTETKDEPKTPYPNSPHYAAATAGKTFVGLIAQEVEVVFPSMVSQRAAYIDGEQVTDMCDLDTSELIFALINAVKQLNAKIEAL